MIIASVTIYQCDHCEKTFAVKNDADFETFSQTWESSLFSDFCPDCKNKPEAVEQTKEDYERILQVAGELEKPAGLQV